MLEDRNVNINKACYLVVTSQFVTIFKIFEDFRVISQPQEEVDNMNEIIF